jgi:hypothetical protein
VFVDFGWFSLSTAIISLNGINQLIFVMVKCGVLREVRSEFLNTIYTSFGFKGLIMLQYNLEHECQAFLSFCFLFNAVHIVESLVSLLLISISYWPYGAGLAQAV